MWSLLTRNWNPLSIYEITRTVNNKIFKRIAITAKEMKNLSSKDKNILTFHVLFKIKKMAYSPHLKRHPIHTQTCAVTFLGENKLPVAFLTDDVLKS